MKHTRVFFQPLLLRRQYSFTIIHTPQRKKKGMNDPTAAHFYEPFLQPLLIISHQFSSFAVLSDPAKRVEYDASGCYEIDQYTLRVRFSCCLDSRRLR